MLKTCNLKVFIKWLVAIENVRVSERDREHVFLQYKGKVRRKANHSSKLIQHRKERGLDADLLNVISLFAKDKSQDSQHKHKTFC